MQRRQVALSCLPYYNEKFPFNFDAAEILEGGVQIINNKYLRYGPWVYWQDIIRDNDAPIEVQNNGQRGQR